MNVYGNEKADEKVKLGLKLRTVYHEAITSLNFLKKKCKNAAQMTGKKNNKIQRIRVNTINNSIALQNGKYLKKRCKKEHNHYISS